VGSTNDVLARVFIKHAKKDFNLEDSVGARTLLVELSFSDRSLLISFAEVVNGVLERSHLKLGQVINVNSLTPAFPHIQILP